MQSLRRILHARPFHLASSWRSNCPVCSHHLPSHVPACTKCWSIFSLPPDITHHALLGLPYRPNPFDVDTPTLKRKFREAQAICHPDSWASKNPGKQEIAQTLSARVNQAYQTLLDPLSRAEYILEQNNVHMSETDQVEDMEFMAEIMEAREIIDEAEEVSEVESLVEANEIKITQTIQSLDVLITKEDWPAVKSAAVRLRYLQGIRRAAKHWLESH